MVRIPFQGFARASLSSRSRRRVRRRDGPQEAEARSVVAQENRPKIYSQSTASKSLSWSISPCHRLIQPQVLRTSPASRTHLVQTATLTEKFGEIAREFYPPDNSRRPFLGEVPF